MSGDFEGLMSEQIAWAYGYDGYARLARSPEDLARILEPAWREYREAKRVPDWCGVDLLRAWAFYLVRADRYGGDDGLMEGGSMIDEWKAVLERIAKHESSRAADIPPMDSHPRRLKR